MNDDFPARAVKRAAAAAVSTLQRSRNTSGHAAGQLATLRRAHSQQPGANPSLWDLEIAPFESISSIATSEARRATAEQALHGALCLYASHQQSRADDMHQPGIGLGKAVGRLMRKRPGVGDSPSPVRRRFDAAVTADTLDEVVYHLRGLVTQMRADGIGLDYGRLANDFYLIASPKTADDVRRRWGRDLYSRETDETTTEGATS